MLKEYVTYVHQINYIPFYVGSGVISRAYDKSSRNFKWQEIVHNNKGLFDIDIIFRGTPEECIEVEQEYLNKYFDVLCNLDDVASTPTVIPKTPSLIEIKKKIGENIKLARKKRKISASELSEKANIDRTTLWVMEKGEGNIGINSYLNILFILGFHNDIRRIGEEDKIGDMIIKNDILN